MRQLVNVLFSCRAHATYLATCGGIIDNLIDIIWSDQTLADRLALLECVSDVFRYLNVSE